MSTERLDELLILTPLTMKSWKQPVRIFLRK